MARTTTNQECRKCKAPLDKYVDVMRAVNIYVCTECGAQYERNLGNSEKPVGKEITSDGK